MGRKCCVPMCKSGYKTAASTSAGVSFHQFPSKESPLHHTWIRNIPRDKFEPSDHSFVCSLHFKQSDFQVESKDTNQYRKERTSELRKRRLLPTAVPTVFTNLPHYYSKKSSLPRSGRATQESRFQQQVSATEEMSKSFLLADQISSLQDLSKKLDCTCLPEEVKIINSTTQMILAGIRSTKRGKPEICYSLVINAALYFTMWCGEAKIGQRRVTHICAKKSLTSSSQVLNIMAFLRNLYDDKSKIICEAEECLSILNDIMPRLEESQGRKISFLVEQLELALQFRQQPRYSPSLLSSAALWENTSPALYRQLHQEDILTLPSPRHLRDLSSSFTVSTGISDATRHYLKLRHGSLSEMECLVNLSVDEVYTCRRIEYSGGNFYGYDAKATATLLCFMIKSIAGRYQDMVCMVPVVHLDAKLLQDTFLLVLKEVFLLGFHVISVTVDGYSVNRKFYSQLSEGMLKVKVPHPYDGQAQLHLLFDSVHVFKSIYNNFVNRRSFSCPSFDGEKVAPNFDHIEELYRHEIGQPIKYAHKLSDKVLHPKPIEKTKVELADRLFHESTISAMDFYAERGFHKWRETASFLRLIRTWWNVVNVRNPKLGQQKQDPVRDPITVDDLGGVQFLEKFAKWLDQWESSVGKEDGLTKETFMTSQQTTRGLAAMAIYLLEEKKLHYVLLGQITSDPIEKRFGWYRQLGGANYFLSARQILESEKKIRLQSLVKMGTLKLAEIREVLQEEENSNDEGVFDSAVQLLSQLEESEAAEDLECNEEEGIMYFVAGYISKSLAKLTKCSSCCNVLVKSSDAPAILAEEEECAAKSAFLDQINRGGLVTPSDIVFLTCLHSRQLFKLIFTGGEAEKYLLSCKNARKVFVSALELRAKNEPSMCAILDHQCQKSHSFGDFLFGKIVARIFNVFSKNFVREINDKIHEGRKRMPHGDDSAAGRKILKLQSE